MTDLPPCVVLGGGLGTRMRPATDRVPKPLLPVAGEPFVVHQLRWLAAGGVTDVVYSIGHLGHLIREALDGRDLGCAVRFVDEGGDRLGTGGAVRLSVVEAGIQGPFFVLYGDSYLQVDPRSVWEEFVRLGAGIDALMTVYRNDGRWGPSNARAVGDRVERYDKDELDPPGAGMAHIDYGLTVLRAETALGRLPAGSSDLAHLLRDLSVAGRLGALEVDRRFYEIGSPEGLADLEQHLEART